MVAPIPVFVKKLTGRVRPRRTWFNKCIMQVEVRCDQIPPFASDETQPAQVLSTHYEWRDATHDDFIRENTFELKA